MKQARVLEKRPREQISATKPERMHKFLQQSELWMNYKQDGWLAPACFSHEYKFFDQHLPTVKNETTV